MHIIWQFVISYTTTENKTELQMKYIYVVITIKIYVFYLAEYQ